MYFILKVIITSYFLERVTWTSPLQTLSEIWYMSLVTKKSLLKNSTMDILLWFYSQHPFCSLLLHPLCAVMLLQEAVPLPGFTASGCPFSGFIVVSLLRLLHQKPYSKVVSLWQLLRVQKPCLRKKKQIISSGAASALGPVAHWIWLCLMMG